MSEHLEKLLKRGNEFLLGPVESIRLRAFEICFTTAFFIYFCARFFYYREWLTPYGFHYTPSAHLSYEPTPFTPLQEWSALLFGLATLAGVVAVLNGKFRRFGLAILLGASFYIQHVDTSASFTLNKLYIVCFLLLLLSPKIEPKHRSDEGKLKSTLLASAWSFRVLQTTLLMQVFFAGTCKAMHGDWLIHSDTLWTQIQGTFRTDFAAYLLRMMPLWAWAGLQHLSFAYELALPFLLMSKRGRIPGLILSVGFTLIIMTTMHQLIYFMLQMLAFFVLFLKASELDWMKNHILKAGFNRK